jgi:hypothetical protein
MPDSDPVKSNVFFCAAFGLVKVELVACGVVRSLFTGFGPPKLVGFWVLTLVLDKG